MVSQTKECTVLYAKHVEIRLINVLDIQELIFHRLESQFHKEDKVWKIPDFFLICSSNSIFNNPSMVNIIKE